MKLLKFIPLWLISGILYGLSWPIFEGINLSFLAWFAFVPLFVFLEKNKQFFFKSMIASFAAMLVFAFFSAIWIFNFPVSKLNIALGFFSGVFWFFVPFLFLYFLQKKIGFEKVIWFFPFIWMLWEWMYLPLEFTLGTHMLPYSQSNNIWLIQYIEYTGMWGVSLWLMLFNVLIYKVVKSVNYNLKASLFYKKIGYISLLMLGIPLFFYFLSYQKYNHIKGKSIDVTVVPTRFSARYFENLNKNFDVVELTLKKTDIVAFNKKALNQYSDLYIWPETGLPFTLQQTNLSDLLLEAVTDWESALLTGGKGIADFSNSLDKRAYVSGVLLSHRNNTISYHHKTVLTPGQEVIPYHSLLAKIPKFPISEFDTRYFKKGEQSKPLALTTRENKSFLVGVSLCYEQWYPKHWINLAQNGAEFYTHLAAEGWYGKFGFKKFMLNVTRMRCIENRKQTARSANDGLSGFIDQMGRNHNITNRINSAIVSSKIIANDNVTFYAKYPNWFPIVGLFILTIALCIYLYESKFYPILK